MDKKLLQRHCRFINIHRYYLKPIHCTQFSFPCSRFPVNLFINCCFREYTFPGDKL
jgi:hypothetical protein